MEVIKLCPKCGSGKVKKGISRVTHDSAEASCTACGWLGTTDELITTPTIAIPRDLDDIANTEADVNLAIARNVSDNYLKQLAAQASQFIGSAMLSAGVIGIKDTINLTRLIKAATLGAHTETLREIERIQKEATSDG